MFTAMEDTMCCKLCFHKATRTKNQDSSARETSTALGHRGQQRPRAVPPKKGKLLYEAAACSL